MTQFPWAKLAGVTAALAALTAAICALIPGAPVAAIVGLVTAGFPVLVGAVVTVAQAYVAAKGPENTSVDEVLKALAEGLSQAQVNAAKAAAENIAESAASSQR